MPRRTPAEMAQLRQEIEDKRVARQAKKNTRESKLKTTLKQEAKTETLPNSVESRSTSHSTPSTKAERAVLSYCKASFITPSSNNRMLRDTLERFYEFIKRDGL